MKILLFTQLICLLSLSIAAQSIDTFYIDKNGNGNYTTITAAVNVLKTTNLSKPRVYIIKAGTYTENISIPQINGSSASNYVIFHGENKNTVIINSSSGKTIELKGADHFTFENMTVKGIAGTCFYLHNSSNFNTIDNCLVIGDTVNIPAGYAIWMEIAASWQTASSNFTVANNNIKGGYSSIRIAGTDSNNRIENIYVFNNQIKKNYQSGIDVNNCIASVIENNRIGLPRNPSNTSNLSITNSNKSTIKKNYVYQSLRGIVVWYDNYQNSTINDTSFIINNIIIPDFNNASSTSGLSFILSNRVIAYNNSIWVHNGGTNISTMALRYMVANECEVFNNIFVATGKSYCVLVSNSTNIKSDYNDYYYPNVGTNAFYINNVAISYAQFKLTSFGYAHDMHSYNNTNPHFKSNTDLHLDSTYYPLYGIDKGITTDIDGDPRCPYKTVIGADESRYPVQKPNAAFSVSTIPCVSTSVLFKNTSTGITPMGYQWLHNGVPVATTGNYSYYFSTPTTDTITLIAENCGGPDSMSKIITIEPPQADFIVNNQTPIVNHDTVKFTNLTDCNPDVTKWDIQPTTFTIISDYPNGQNPKIVFNDTGCYDVTLIVARGGFYDTLVRVCNILAIDSVYITLIGANPHMMEVCHGYKDAGATCFALSGNPPHLNYDSSYQNISDSGTKKWLFWAINPSTMDTIKAIRAVYVSPDLTKPILTLLGNNTDTIEVGTIYNDPGFISSDSCGIITDSVIGNVNDNLVGKYILKYFSFDVNGNSDTVERIVFVVDITPPTLALKDDTVIIEVFNKYEPLFTIADNYCPENAMIIHFNENIDTSKLGYYFNDIWVEDCNGNFSDTLTQTVHVVDQTSPILIWSGPDTFYLERYKILNTDTDTFLTIWDNYDTNIMAVASGTYYSDYLMSRGEGCYSIIYNSTDQSGNVSNEIIVWVCIIPSAINESIVANDIKVYPNPNNGHFVIENINSNQPINAVNIFNSQGKLVYSTTNIDYFQPQIEIDLRQAAGLYFVMLKSDSGIVMKKVVLE